MVSSMLVINKPREQKKDDDDDDLDNNHKNSSERTESSWCGPLVNGSRAITRNRSHTVSPRVVEAPTALNFEIQTDGVKNQQPTVRKRHGARNQHKMKYFVRWLTERFPEAMATAKAATTAAGPSTAESFTENKEMDTNHDSNNNIKSNKSAATLPQQQQPRQQRYILDVAGGKGELAVRLAVCCGCQVVLVDPRRANLLECCIRTVVPVLPKKYQQRIQEQEQTAHSTRPCAPVLSATDPKNSTPNSLESSHPWMNQLLNSRIQQLVLPFHFPFDNNCNISSSSIHHHKAQSSSPSTGTWNNQRQNKNDHNSMTTTTETADVSSWNDVLESATLLIGMHADGATEDIVDAALYYQKPFVVVPCCVFPKSFPNRFLPSSLQPQEPGEQPPPVQVKTYEQFCHYLLAKGKGQFHMEELPVEGRNIAIWWEGGGRTEK